MDLKAAVCTIATVAAVACSSSSTSPTPPPSTAPPPQPATATFVATFDENPVPFRSSGCSVSAPRGWYTSVRLQETAGVAFTPVTLTQKLDGNPASILNESFNSRFGACGTTAFTGVISASGAACATVGVCTASSFGTYQFEINGTDANNHTVTFASPVLQLGARPAGQ